MSNLPALNLVTPSSVTTVSGTASIGANGTITYSGVSELAVNGVFSATYDNYLLVMEQTGTDVISILLRYRASGTNDAGSNYAYVRTDADGASYTTATATSLTQTFMGQSSAEMTGDHVYIFGPFLAQKTVHRTVAALGYLNGYYNEQSGFHSLSSSYDGFWLSANAGTFGGTLRVYGLTD